MSWPIPMAGTCERVYPFITYDSSKFWHRVLCDSSLNSPCWVSNCEVCKNGKTLHLDVDPETIVSWKEWCVVEVGQKRETLQCQVRTGWTGELPEILMNQWLSTLTHTNIKHIQSSQFN